VVHYNLSIRGGAERVAVEIGNAVVKAGHELAFFTNFYDPETSFERLHDLNVICVKGRREVLGVFRAYLAFSNLSKVLRTRIRLFQPDILVLSSGYYLASKFHPSIVYCHFPERHLVRNRSALRHLLHYPIDRSESRGFRAADIVLANSMFTAGTIKRSFGIEACPVYPGVDTSAFKFSTSDDGYALTVSRICPYKNLEFLPRVYDILAAKGIRIPLRVAGVLESRYVKYFKILKKLWNEYGLDDLVLFTLNPKDEELSRLYQSCEIFLYPAVNEHFGLGPLEAMASGKPVIASDSGGPCETVIDKVTGERLPLDPYVWARTIEELHADNSMRLTMGLEGRKIVEKKFTWEHFHEEMGKYFRLLEEKVRAQASLVRTT